MASFNLTIEDCSPLFIYGPAGAWTDSSNDDPLAQSYSGQSYHSTNVQGAIATIKFSGTGISIFGGRRSNYGTYSISVDGQTIASGDAKSAENLLQQTLGTVSGLPNGDHIAVVTNVSGAVIDVDSAMVVNEIGTAGSLPSTKIFDDTDPSISYLPSASAWGTNNQPTFQNNSLHFSQVPDASASFPFVGDAIAIYGTVSPDHADIRINIDDDTVVLPGGSAGKVSQLHTQVLLYYRSGLGSGQHNFVLSGDSQNTTGPFIDLDSISVYSELPPADGQSGSPSSVSSVGPPQPSGTAETAMTSNNSSTDGNGTHSGSKHVSIGLIVGSAIGGVVGLCLFALCFFVLWRRRRRINNKPFQRPISPISPQLPMQIEPKVMETGMIPRIENPVFIFPPERVATTAARHSIAPSYYSSPLSLGTPTHSRDTSVMSSSSGAPLMKSAPIPNRLYALPRKPVPLAYPEMVMTENSRTRTIPMRPARRPTFIDFNALQ